MRDCEWINVQLAADNVQRREERRQARLERVARLFHLRRAGRRTPVFADAGRG